MGCYRYVTPAVHGQWHFTREAALADAVRARQAQLKSGEVVLRSYVRIEEQPEANCLDECEAQEAERPRVPAGQAR